MLLNASYQQIEDYKILADALDWSSYLDTEQIRLLDIGCGTGRWLTAFQSKLENNLEITLKCDLLDPSLIALQEVAKTLSPPLFPNQLIQDTIQNTELPPSHYDIIWAMHSFYSIPEKDLVSILKKCQNSLNERGQLFIGQSSNKSFYIQFYDLFSSYYSIDQIKSYTSAEMILNAFQILEIEVEVEVINYVERIHVNDFQRLNHYILNECIGYSFDRDVNTIGELTIKEILNHPIVGAFLERYIIDDHYEFSQDIWLLQSKKNRMVRGTIRTR